MNPIEPIEHVEAAVEKIESDFESRLIEAKAYLVEAMNGIEELKEVSSAGMASSRE